MKLCIVSPHLDDALLSCGILMQRRRAAGDEVLVANIFTAGTDAEKRRREEEQAEAVVGAQPHFLDEFDAPDRNPLYKTLKNIFFAPLRPDDPVIDKVARRLAEFFAQHKVDAAYFPLGAGGHIDHRVAFEAGRRLKSPAIRFYEDRPYILWPGVLQGRMNQIGVEAKVIADTAKPVTAKTMADTVGKYHYLTHFMPTGTYKVLGHSVPEGDYRRETLPVIAAALKAPESFSLRGTEETLTAGEEELKTLYRGLALYGSQMGHIYKDYANFLSDSHSYELAVSGRKIYAERSWALTALSK
jgi:LmbE family N-acetylglucosaminyl deacetylase